MKVSTGLGLILFIPVGLSVLSYSQWKQEFRKAGGTLGQSINDIARDLGGVTPRETYQSGKLKTRFMELEKKEGNFFLAKALTDLEIFDISVHITNGSCGYTINDGPSVPMKIGHGEQFTIVANTGCWVDNIVVSIKDGSKYGSRLVFDIVENRAYEYK
jgi:hypothetical protein